MNFVPKDVARATIKRRLAIIEERERKETERLKQQYKKEKEKENKEI